MLSCIVVSDVMGQEFCHGAVFINIIVVFFIKVDHVINALLITSIDIAPFSFKTHSDTAGQRPRSDNNSK